MKSKNNIWFAIAMIWVSMSIAVSIAMYITKSATPLWAMIIPTFLDISIGEDEK